MNRLSCMSRAKPILPTTSRARWHAALRAGPQREGARPHRVDRSRRGRAGTGRGSGSDRRGHSRHERLRADHRRRSDSCRRSGAVRRSAHLRGCAESYDAARRAARLADIDYEELPAVLSPRRPNGSSPSSCRRCISSAASPRQSSGRAAHAARASCMSAVRSSSTWKGRSPTPAQRASRLARALLDSASRRRCSISWRAALDVPSNHVTVEVRRMGGGFGGKESQSALFACVARLAAQRLGRPVKLRLDRDDDFMATGKRHCFLLRVRGGLRRRRQRSFRAASRWSHAPAFPPICRRRSPRAPCVISTTRTTSATSTSRRCAARPTRSRTLRFAGSAGRRARSPSSTSSTTSRASSTRIRSRYAKSTSTGHTNATSRPTARPSKTTSFMSWSASSRRRANTSSVDRRAARSTRPARY